MKKLIFAIAAIATLMVVSIADGASEQEIMYGGYWCKTSHKTRSIACVPVNGKGYNFGISRDVILVTKGNKIVLSRRNR